MLNTAELYSGKTDLAAITPLDTIFAEYRSKKDSIEKIAEFVSGNSAVMSYFFDGARVSRNTGSYSASTFFEVKHAIASLDAEYWARVMSMTDVLESMPASKRNEWNKQIREHETPEFLRDTVHSTMNDLLVKRQQFFAERVDGIFRALSAEHLTNRPEGFMKRMIINRMMTYYQTVDHDTANYIHDLRSVIGTFMGREIPHSRSTDYAISHIYDSGDTGQWHSFDGGAWKIKLFKKGTAHIDIHSSMAYRLNQVLASMYPTAIPAKFKTKPKRFKEHEIKMDLLPFAVLDEIGHFRENGDDSITFYSTTISKQTERVLRYIGGENTWGSNWTFGYPVKDILQDIIRTGSLPEKKTHQFFQTPEALADRVVDIAEIGEKHSVLEPSAGHGAICKFLPKERLTCIELAYFNCRVLQKKGYSPIQADFLQWESDLKFDRVILNPPYSKNRALDHLKKARQHLANDGRLVAILPASMKEKEFFPGLTHEWSEVLSNEFRESGTGVNVVILTLYR